MIPIYYIHVHISIYLFIYSFCFMLLWNSVFSSFHFSRVRNLHQEVLGNKSKRKDFPKRVKRFQSPVPFIMWLTSITVHGRTCLCPILLLLDLNLSIFSPYRQLLYLFTSLINMFKMLPTPSSAKKNPTSSDSTAPPSITWSLLNQTYWRNRLHLSSSFDLPFTL